MPSLCIREALLGTGGIRLCVHYGLLLCDGVGVWMYRNTPVMRAAAVWYVHVVVGRSETAKAPNWYDYALRGRRGLCVHDGALRVGVFDASESYGHARRARRVGYIDVTVGGSKQLRRPTSNFGGI